MLTSILKCFPARNLWLCVICLLTTSSLASAQGLVWSLPESGTGVKYTGDYRQTTYRPQSTQGDLSLDWRRTMEIRCLEREMADYQGANVACVWLEYEVVTGQQVDGNLESGPGGTRIYKVLMPESAIKGIEFFQSKVPNAFVPVVKGFQKIGDAEVEEFKHPVLQIFPVLSQVFLNEKLTVTGSESISVTAGQYDAQKIECQSAIEDPQSRTTNTTQVWVSDDIPFGTVQWKVRIDREVKTVADTRDQFRKHSEITIDMQAAQLIEDVTSKISTP